MGALWSAFQTIGGLLLLAAVAGGIYLFVQSLPDIARYVKIKQM